MKTISHKKLIDNKIEFADIEIKEQIVRSKLETTAGWIIPFRDACKLTPKRKT